MALSPRAGGAIGLVVAGIFVMFFGGGLSVLCGPACGLGPDLVVALGVVVLLAGIGVGLAAAYSGPRTIYPTTDPAVPPPIIRPVVVQQTIVQQTVEVRCRYCGRLNPVTATQCAGCGAAL